MADKEYTTMSSTPILKSKNEGNLSSQRRIYFTPCLLILSFTMLLIFVLWQLYLMSFTRIFKSVIAGSLLVYYSWELIYFDSVRPGIQPTSPLSPPSIRMLSGHILHLNYIFALLIGIFFTLFVGWFC